MALTNLDNFYFKKGANDAYDPNGTYAKLLDNVGIAYGSESYLPLCDFFADYNAANSATIRKHISAPAAITAIDPTFVTQPLWTGKTFKAGVDCQPARKYDMEVLSHLDFTATGQIIAEASSTNVIATAGVLVMTAGGGGGGGGDGGGWLDEPSGGGGGGSGAGAIVYYRYKTLNRTKQLSINFDTIYGGSGGSAETTGGTGTNATLVYNGVTYLTCGGGAGGAGSNTANTNSGGAGGTFTLNKSYSGNILEDDDEIFMYLLYSTNGLQGQSSGQGGVSGNANGFNVTVSNIPSSNPSVTSITISKTGGAGGKANNSDPGGGGGAASICGNGGDGSTGDAASVAGSWGSGGGGGAERSTPGANGGAGLCIVYS